MAKEKIVLIDDAGNGAFLDFLEKQLLSKSSVSPQNLSQTTIPSGLKPYLLEGSNGNYTSFLNEICVFSKEPYTSTNPSLRCSWETLLKDVSVPIALVCAAGGSKAFIDLLKCWVEERKSRKIMIKEGDTEIVIEGSMSRKDIDRTIEIFEKHFGRSKILKP